MIMEKKKLYCYSHSEFDTLMENLYGYEIPVNVMCISICNSDNGNARWFSNSNKNCINLDFDDTDTQKWWNKTNETYESILKKYTNNENTDEFFIKKSKTGSIVKAMDYSQAEKLFNFIEETISKVDTIYVHCSAGQSRSQAVVRYILDVYGNEYKFETRKENPCDTPNFHVVCMLKRIFYYRVMNMI